MKGRTTVSELLHESLLGYFVISMVPVIFYLCLSLGIKRFLFQSIVVFPALMIHHTQILMHDSFFKVYLKSFCLIQESLILSIFLLLNLQFVNFIVYELELDAIK